MVSKAIQDVQDDIRSMKIRGAGTIARATANALADFSENYHGSSLEDYLKNLEDAKNTLLNSRPTAVSLYNAVMITANGAENQRSVEQAKEIVTTNGREFVLSSEKAVEEIAKIGANRIQDGETLLTHCNSKVALGIIIRAAKSGKNIKVYATESRPWRQGILTVKDLSDAGVDVTLIIDSAVHFVMNSVNRVFVGADTITSSGSLINKIGTSQIALCAHESRTEFNVCAETYKFSIQSAFGGYTKIEERDPSEIVKKGEIPDSVKIFNPVFDVTPQQYISHIITEKGIMHPSAVYGYISKFFGSKYTQINGE